MIHSDADIVDLPSIVSNGWCKNLLPAYSIYAIVTWVGDGVVARVGDGTVVACPGHVCGL